MAITTLDGVIAGMRPPEDFLKAGATMESAGVHHSLFYTAGRPGAAVAPSPGLAGAALTSYAGQIPWVNPASGNSYLARLEASGNASGTLLLCDRLWHNSGIVVTTTTVQTVNSVAWPARDRDGSTNGESVLAALEFSAASTNAAIGNTTLSYTDQSGNAGATATLPTTPATIAAGSFLPFPLAAGDTGIRSIQSITLGTSYLTGTMHLVAYRVLARLGCSASNVPAALDAVTGGFVRLYNDSVPFLVWLPTGTAGITLNGQLVVSQG
jgi:hypothetical protein